jgi:hypothetical protein
MTHELAKVVRTKYVEKFCVYMSSNVHGIVYLSPKRKLSFPGLLQFEFELELLSPLLSQLALEISFTISLSSILLTDPLLMLSLLSLALHFCKVGLLELLD